MVQLMMQPTTNAFGTRMPARPLTARARGVAAARAARLDVRADNVLIVNTKGGGHAFIGLHLAKALMAKGHKVTILNDGDPEKVKAKGPYAQYDALEAEGASVVWGNPKDPATYPAGSFEVVYDNNGKDMDNCKPVIDHFSAQGGVSHYVFVASAGAYVPSKIEPGHWEGDTRKASAGHVEVEAYLAASQLPWTVCQPLYLYGPHNAKDCEQFFLDRIMRDRTVLLPTPGIQLTTLSHVEDVAALLAAVPGTPAAVGQQYNMCSDRCVSFDGIVQILSQAAGKEPKMATYDPEALGLKKGEGFPFRTVHFFADSSKAKRELGWAPKHRLSTDAKALVEEYVASGRGSKEIDFSVDDKILAKLAA